MLSPYIMQIFISIHKHGKLKEIWTILIVEPWPNSKCTIMAGCANIHVQNFSLTERIHGKYM